MDLNLGAGRVGGADVTARLRALDRHPRCSC